MSHISDFVSRLARRGASLLCAALLLLSLAGCGGKTPSPSGSSTGGGTVSIAPAPAESFSTPGSTARQQTETRPPETEAPAPDESWKLLLVNADHPLPEGFQVELKALRNGHHVDVRIYPELQQMFDDARAQGIYPFINESFRTAQRQQVILYSYISRYEAQGMSRAAAEQKALEIVALPGTSEHQLGLALDIIAEFDADNSATWQWLKRHCAEYGFILRYPADKESITGISYEPWHFRYVGVEAAREIMSSGLCLEEYLDQLKP